MDFSAQQYPYYYTMSHYQIELKNSIDAENATHACVHVKLTNKHKKLIRRIVDEALLIKLQTIASLVVVAMERDDDELFWRMDKKNKELITEIQELIDSKKDLVTDDEYLMLCAFTKKLYN